jgi:hypothetical protein
MGVGTRQCRVLTVSNINSDATGVDMIVEQASCLLLKILLTKEIIQIKVIQKDKNIVK